MTTTLDLDMADPAILRHLDDQYDILRDCLSTMDRRFRALMLLSAVVDSAQASNIPLSETLTALATVWRWTEDKADPGDTPSDGTPIH